MRSNVIKTLVLLLAFLLQYSIVPKLSIYGFSANLCVLALVGVCYFSAPAASAVYGGALGLAMDSAAGRSFGVQLLLCMYLGLAVKAIASEKINNSPAFMAMYLWLFTAMYYLAYGLLSGAVPTGRISIGRWLLTAGVTAFINGLVSIPIFWFTEKKTRRKAHE